MADGGAHCDGTSVAPTARWTVWGEKNKDVAPPPPPQDDAEQLSNPRLYDTERSFRFEQDAVVLGVLFALLFVHRFRNTSPEVTDRTPSVDRR